MLIVIIMFSILSFVLGIAVGYKCGEDKGFNSGYGNKIAELRYFYEEAIRDLDKLDSKRKDCPKLFQDSWYEQQKKLN